MVFDWRTTQGERLRPPERELLYQWAQAVQLCHPLCRPTIVNIGVSWGASLHCLHAGAPAAHLVAIDIDFDSRPVRHADRLGEVEYIQADSARYPFQGPVHMLFVDGGHEYEQVKADIDNWIPHIPLGGIVAFHDYAPEPQDAARLAGVRQAVNEWRNDNWQEANQMLSTIVFRRRA